MNIAHLNASQNRLLHLLKTRGEADSHELAAQLAMTSMGARQHLEQMAEEELVSFRFVSEGKGRPKKKWRLSEKGHSYFPDRHSALLVNLLGQMQTQLGESAVEQLILARESEMRFVYQAQLDKAPNLQSKLERLAAIRSEEGYMAEIRREGTAYLLIENHCPICSAATQCQQFCRSELSLFQQVLDCQVERCNYLLDGDRRCVYRVTPRD